MSICIKHNINVQNTTANMTAGLFADQNLSPVYSRLEGVQEI